MTLNDVHTEKFMFDPKKKDFEERMIKKSKIFNFPRKRKQWLIYLCVVYDMNSEVRRNYKHYTERKIIGAEVAEFKRNTETGHYDPETEKRLLGEDMDFNRAICEFLYFMYNNDYKLLDLLIDKYDYAIEEQRTRLAILNDKDRKSLQGMKKEIEELEEKIFGGEETVNMKRALYEGVDNIKNLLPRKENEMLEYERDGLMSRSPFGNYKPAPLKFVGDSIPSN